MSHLFDLTGKVAIVTGGNGGIGYGIAQGLAEAGAVVVIAARDEKKTVAAVERIRARNGKCAGTKCDVTNQVDINATVGETVRQFGRLDILVNNAGVSAGGAPQSIPAETWDKVLDTNLKSAFQFSQAVYPEFVKVGGGKIINIGSEYSIFGSAVVLPYSVSKGGVIQLTKSLAIAWARQNIQVNAIIPGWIRTDMTAGVISNRASFEHIVQRTPAGRFGEPEELAGAAVFLASAASDFVTGISLQVDGGYSVY